jgi:alpha-beta hydrolase superfamily lysophospholipase
VGEYQELTIELADGYASYARYWPAPRGAPAVLHIHGIQSHCGWYTDTCRAINAAGFAVLQPDRRGSGQNARERGAAESAQQLIDDGLRSAQRLCELSGATRVHLVGVSWGGKLVTGMHVTRPELTASLVLVAPGLFPIVDVSTAEKFRIGWSMVSNPERLYDIPLNDPALFTADPRWQQFLRDDALQLHQASAGFYLASRRMDRICAKLGHAPAVPLQLYLAGEEKIIDNAATRKFVEELPWPDRHIVQYDHSRHTFEFGPDRDQYVRDLIEWLTPSS